MVLNINGKTLCPMCFSPIEPQLGKCSRCTELDNKSKYPTALKERTILLGKYSVGRVLGKGGFGVTYLCYDMSKNRKVAIKEFFPDSIACRTSEKGTVSSVDMGKVDSFKNYASKFYDEAKLVSTFNGNPNIINVFEFFYENNTAYFVMEALEGMDLKQYMKQRNGKLAEDEAIYIMTKVLDALAVIHSQNILHRDISPDNIYMCGNGNIKLIDFGAARQVVGEESKSLSVILKQGFAPLEQYQKHGAQGPWTDIYALGATFYYVITGKLIDDAMTRLDDEKLNFSGVSDGIAQIISKMLAVKRENRFQNVAEVKNALTALQIQSKPTGVKSYCISCGKEIKFGETKCAECAAKTSHHNVSPNTTATKKVTIMWDNEFKNSVPFTVAVNGKEVGTIKRNSGLEFTINSDVFDMLFLPKAPKWFGWRPLFVNATAIQGADNIFINISTTGNVNSIATLTSFINAQLHIDTYSGLAQCNQEYVTR